MPEGERGSTFTKREAVKTAFFVATALYFSRFAFSRGVRREIIKRDGGCCVGEGCCGHLEASHFNHDKSDPMYDTPDNGRALCTFHHLEDHIERAGANGLPEHQNNWAIKMLSQRLETFRQEALERV